MISESYTNVCGSTGIGQGRVTDNLATFVKDLDGSFTIADEKSIVMLYQLLDTEGLYLGASSALNVVAALELAQTLGKGVFRISLQTIANTRTIGRIERRHCLSRRRIPLPEPALLQAVVAV